MYCHRKTNNMVHVKLPDLLNREMELGYDSVRRKVGRCEILK